MNLNKRLHDNPPFDAKEFERRWKINTQPSTGESNPMKISEPSMHYTASFC